MNIVKEITTERLASFNLQVGRDYTEAELDRAVEIHGMFAAKMIMHDKTVRESIRYPQ